MLPAMRGAAARFDTPISVDTWRAVGRRGAYELGAVIGNDISGFADPDYLPGGGPRGRDRRRHPHPSPAARAPIPSPSYDDVVADVAAFLLERAERAQAAGVAADRIVLDAGLDLGKTWQQSLELLRRSDTLADLGYPLLLSASNKTFLGKLLDLEIGERREASHAATALGVHRAAAASCASTTCAGTRRVCDVLAALHEASAA